MKAHELHEEVNPVIDLSRKSLLGKSSEFAINSAHGVAFHRGLGNPLHPSSSTPITKYLHEDRLKDYSEAAYAKSNFAVVANGANHQELSKWVGEFFTESPTSTSSEFSSVGTSPSKYYGGEERVAHDSGNTMILAFPGSGSATGGSWKPELSVLASLLGGQSNIKWTPGFSLLSKATAAYPQARIVTTHNTYSDAGLLTVSMSGNAQQVRGAAQEVVKVLKSVAAGNVSKEDIKKASATAKFKALESGQNIDTGIESTGAGLVQGGKALQLDEVAKSIDGVTEDQVKKVSWLTSRKSIDTQTDLGSKIGCEVYVGWKSNGFRGWRPVHTPVCGGIRSQRLNTFAEHDSFVSLATFRKPRNYRELLHRTASHRSNCNPCFSHVILSRD